MLSHLFIPNLAYLSGVKANYGTIGVNGKVSRKDCTAQLDAATHTRSIAQWAVESGKSIGLVTTTRSTYTKHMISKPICSPLL